MGGKPLRVENPRTKISQQSNTSTRKVLPRVYPLIYTFPKPEGSGPPVDQTVVGDYSRVFGWVSWGQTVILGVEGRFAEGFESRDR